MPRSQIMARELRGAVVVVLVALLIVWLFAKINDDRAEAKAQRESRNTTTSVATDGPMPSILIKSWYSALSSSCAACIAVRNATNEP